MLFYNTQCQLLPSQHAQMVTSDWWMVQSHQWGRAEWRSATTMFMAASVMTSGTLLMQVLCADSWASMNQKVMHSRNCFHRTQVEHVRPLHHTTCWMYQSNSRATAKQPAKYAKLWWGSVKHQLLLSVLQDCMTRKFVKATLLLHTLVLQQQKNNTKDSSLAPHKIFMQTWHSLN